ncbi:TlpA family protein disulfide reductase [Methanococcoides alaskense]|uniref:Thiol-disulfide isomerase/thioredoxin n=1 Tax=Methanococcoides alaskense TaxID=325778 RepID=A0AA90U153_9EURY|nr:redoxin domain-containing protein [Methanococcoides alaskense]MDA0524297.1 redoxin domain-containing protein [Methanococcoides alaskense]MDR6223751.1 thiol-disulfide isomerase/thioredoxin [Methanococcoides alaskense]
MYDIKHSYGLFIALIITLVLISGCIGTETDEGTEPEEVIDWKEVELTDTITGDTFKISDFEGQTVMLETFAVWCPTCLQQQKEMEELAGIKPGVIHISLDTDPNEDTELVRDHAEKNGFDWYFAVAPIEMTESLIDEFGFVVVNAPSAPVVLICNDQSTRLLDRGLKQSDELIMELEEGC